MFAMSYLRAYARIGCRICYVRSNALRCVGKSSAEPIFHSRTLERFTMKYTVSIEIAMPREEVAQLLADPANMPKWLRGLVLHEPLSGVHGQIGTKSRVVMQMGQQKFEGTETITRREPADLHGIP